MAAASDFAKEKGSLGIAKNGGLGGSWRKCCLFVWETGPRGDSRFEISILEDGRVHGQKSSIVGTDFVKRFEDISGLTRDRNFQIYLLDQKHPFTKQNSKKVAWLGTALERSANDLPGSKSKLPNGTALRKRSPCAFFLIHFSLSKKTGTRAQTYCIRTKDRVRGVSFFILPFCFTQGVKDFRAPSIF